MTEFEAEKQADELFSGVHATHCSFCGMEDKILPGWPLNGQFLVQRTGKICQRCVREVVQKAEALGLQDRRS